MKRATINILLAVFVIALHGCAFFKVPLRLPGIMLPASVAGIAHEELPLEEELPAEFRLETYPDDPTELRKFIEELNDHNDITATEFEERKKEIRRLREFNPKQDPEIYTYILDTIRSRFLKEAILNAVEEEVAAEIEKNSTSLTEKSTAGATTAGTSPPERLPAPKDEIPATQSQPQTEISNNPPLQHQSTQYLAQDHAQPQNGQPTTVPGNYHANTQVPFVNQNPHNQAPYNQVQYQQGQHHYGQNQQGPYQHGSYQSMQCPDSAQHPYFTQAGYSTTRGGHNRANMTNAAFQSRELADSDDPEANIQNAIDALSAKLSMGKGDANDEARLRLLYLCLGNQREAVRPIEKMDESVRNFWSNQMLGLSTLIDEQVVRDPDVRYASAYEHLETGMEKLSSLRPMKIRNMQFVKNLRKFGDFIPIEGSFVPGEKIVLYFELENLTLKQTPGIGYGVRGSWSIEVRNSNGTVIFKQDNNPFDECLQSKVRDYCSWIDFPLGKSTPQGIDKTVAPGVYFITVTVRDLNHPKQQEARDQIEFRVITRD